MEPGANSGVVSNRRNSLQPESNTFVSIMATYNWNRYDDYTFPLLQSEVSTSSTTGVGWYFMSDAAGDGTWTTYYQWLNNIKAMENVAETMHDR